MVMAIGHQGLRIKVMFELGKVANIEIAKFVHAEDVAFRIRNRRNKQLGLWAASQLDLVEEAMDYATAVAVFGIAEADDERLIRHIHSELLRQGVRVPEAAIRSELERQTMYAVRECTILRPRDSAGESAQTTETLKVLH